MPPPEQHQASKDARREERRCGKEPHRERREMCPFPIGASRHDGDFEAQAGGNSGTFTKERRRPRRPKSAGL